jgi:hypothetical protein
MIRCYKIVENNNGIFKTLFHGVNRSRKLETNKWHEAEQKLVSDGTSKTKYISGFHVLNTYETALKYLEKFTHRENKKIVKCIAEEIVPKAHSRDPVFLARYIHIFDQE